MANESTVKTYPYDVSQDPPITRKDVTQKFYYDPLFIDSDGLSTWKTIKAPSKTLWADTMLDYDQVLEAQFGKRDSKGVNIEAVQTYVSIPGTIVKTLLEFPEYQHGKLEGQSLFIELDDIISLSYSVYRAKAPVVTLGQNSVGGYALGTKTVAGSMIRSVFMTDNLTEFQSKCYLADKEEMKKRLNGINGKISKGTPLKEELSVMKDDLTVFNIHTVVMTEEANINIPSEYGTPYMKFESILGCVIINNGQVFSIPDVITESTFSFQAKTVKSTSRIEDFTIGFSSKQAFKSGSSLLEELGE